MLTKASNEQDRAFNSTQPQTLALINPHWVSTSALEKEREKTNQIEKERKRFYALDSLSFRGLYYATPLTILHCVSPRNASTHPCT